MSFLSINNAEQLNARITQRGRKAIANGNFNIKYFQVGDSEYDYNSIFQSLTGLTNHQKVMSPFDRESGVKYPYKLDESTSGTTYGVPINGYLSPEPIRNPMGPAGFITEHIEPEGNNGTIIKTYYEEYSLSILTGGTFLYASGTTFSIGETIILTFKEFGGADPNEPVIKYESSSLVYKIVGKSGGFLEVDRNVPNLSGLTGHYQVIKLYQELEYVTDDENCPLPQIDNMHQHNPWQMEVVWTERPIGVNNSGLESSISEYTSNRYVSTKEFLGYTTSSGQTYFDNISGGTLINPTSYVDTLGLEVNVLPEEQRCIAIIHYSENGLLLNDPERFFKYDDYISTHEDPKIIEENDEELTDTEYFEVYIPFIYYHRNTGTTIGAIFHMDETDHYILSIKEESKHQILFRYLLDEQNNKVGKVFPNNKVVVFDDQELVAILDMRSNRKYTLPAPKIGLITADINPQDCIEEFSGSTGSTMWISYFLVNIEEQGKPLNGTPCNYFSKINSTTTPSNITFKFSQNEFDYLKTEFSGFTEGYIAQKFYILMQITPINEFPLSNKWRLFDYTPIISGDSYNYLTSLNLTTSTLLITKNEYEGINTEYDFNLDDYRDTNYTSVESLQFGEEHTFPGSIRVVRASDLETMNFEVNLPSTQFITTQNPTYTDGANKVITEIALLDSNKDPLVVAKTPVPIKRIGNQVFSLKLDF